MNYYKCNFFIKDFHKCTNIGIKFVHRKLLFLEKIFPVCDDCYNTVLLTTELYASATKEEYIRFEKSKILK